MLRRRPSSGTGTRLRAPVVILGFAEYGLFSVYKSSIFLLLYQQTIELLHSSSFAFNSRTGVDGSPSEISPERTERRQGRPSRLYSKKTAWRPTSAVLADIYHLGGH
jgi:hypothetical protein